MNGWSRFRHSVLAHLDDSGARSWSATLVRRGLVALVVVSVACIVLETVPDLSAEFGPMFRAVEDGAVTIFAVEYLLRLWTAPDQAIYAERGIWTARLLFARSVPGLIDLLSVLPAAAGLLFANELKILLLLRLLRFFKLARYSPGMRSLASVLQAERKALSASAVVLLGFVILAAAAMYACEHDVQPEKLGSIPAAMWWAVVTLTTVGYGDVYPVTLWGRMVASVTMVFGLTMLALPVGIVATAFAEEIHRRDFVVSWGMIARVPLFQTLSVGEIGEITRVLHARTVPKGTAVFRKGEEGREMYVITSGEVEVELPTGGVRLGEGHFFGERALLSRSRRTATVRAMEPTRLLVLDASDLQTLMERNTGLGERINAVAEARERENERAGDG